MLRKYMETRSRNVNAGVCNVPKKIRFQDRDLVLKQDTQSVRCRFCAQLNCQLERLLFLSVVEAGSFDGQSDRMVSSSIPGRMRGTGQPASWSEKTMHENTETMHQGEWSSYR